MRKAWKPPSSRPILIYFEFRSKPSLITVICMDPHSPNKLFATKYCFLVLGDDTSFFFFLSLFFVFFSCYFTLLLNFKKILLLLLLLLLLLFHENYFFSGMFRDFPECSGIFRNVPRSGVLSTPDILGWARVRNTSSPKNACVGGYTYFAWLHCEALW